MDNNKDNTSLNERVKREFKITTLALKNKTTVFLLTIAVVIFGLYSYKTMPKELFPDIALPWVLVQTIYPGNSPSDMESLITRPIEKELETINGIKDIKSTSSQDISFILITFNTDVDIKTALQDSKDAVDNAKSELPNDLPSDPIVADIDASEFPVININLSGDFSVDELKKYGEILEDRIETISEISKVEIQGINEKEIKINVDLNRLHALQLAFSDIESAIAYENMSISGGEIKVGGTRRSIRTIGEFESVNEIKDIIVKSENEKIIYLRDVAEVIDGYEEPSSITRLNSQSVISLQVVKKGGENLLSAIAQIEDILREVKQEHIFPENLHITTTNDQSEMVKKQLDSLQNSMIISVIFVVLVLFFFLGTRNALFVGLAIPLSMFMSFVILSMIGYRINMMVLFGLILALGMLVDNAIVAVENIYRFIDQGYTKFEAAKQAVGEIAVAIIASTATTLAAFVPLVFWDSIMGEFMKYLPITLIVVLGSSLFVALVIIPVFSSSFIKKGDQISAPNKQKALKIAGILTILAVLFFAGGINTMGSLLLIGAIVTVFNLFVFHKIGVWFQNVFLVKLENGYLRLLKFVLHKKNPVIFLMGTVFLLIFTIVFMGIRKPDVLFFPDNDPSYINVMAELPVGTDIMATDKFAQILERDIERLIEPDSSIIKSVLTNIGDGAVLEDALDFSSRDNKCLATISFVDFEERKGRNTSKTMKMLSDSLTYRYPGVTVIIEKNRMGPPTGKPINLEIAGQEFEQLIKLSDTIQNVIEQAKIEGIEGLKMDLNVGKPEMIVTIDRDKARRFEMSTGQIASTIRTALFGKEISDFKIGEEEYPIQLRLMEKYRNSISELMNQKIIFMNTQGKWREIPISAVADFTYSTTYEAVKRKDLNRVITLYSNVIEGYNANNINTELKAIMEGFDMPEGYTYKFTGEQEDQQESTEFLMRALLIAISLILIILVTQFNSIVKPFIIIASVLFSTIGVFGGIATFKMDFIVIMTGIGIVSLAGVVVNNAIVLIDYIDLLKARKRKELGLEEDAFLPPKIATECIVKAGKTRLRPVLLTAITTILGLLPMAVGMNIDFYSLLSDFDPKLSFGGDMAAMWSPLSWTVIFGLTFATFLTLVIVPVMYRLTVIIQKLLISFFEKKNNKKVEVSKAK